MDDFEKLSVSKPFGPSIAEFIVKEEFVNDLNEYCKIVLNEEGRAEKLDVGEELAGQVKQEFEVDQNFFNLKINNYLTDMIKNYLWKSVEKQNESFKDFKNKIKVKFVTGEKENFKITHRSDLINEGVKIFYGIGFDIHRLIKNKRCGYEIQTFPKNPRATS